MTRLCIDFLMVALVMVMVMCILVKAEDERKMFERIERKIEGKEDVFTIDYVPRDWLEDEQFVALIDQPLSESKVIQRIIGGDRISSSITPFIAYLKIGRTRCGGAIISDDSIVTAAHCVYGTNTSDITATFKTTNQASSSWDVCSDSLEDQSSVQCEKKIEHASFNQYTLQNDIAVLKFSGEPFKNVQKAIINRQLPDIGTTMNVSGWGTETYGGKISCYLKSASLFRTDCLLDGEGGLGDYRQFYATGMFCARKEGVDACQGDSGGPISQVSGTLYGLVSWGVKCAFKTYPGVYTDISIYSRWIDYVLTL